MNKQIKQWLVYLPVLVLICGSFFAIHSYGVNVPHWDDHAVRVFTDSFDSSKFLQIFSFHNEHRIAFTRITALFTTAVSGFLDFKFLMYLGQFGLVCTFGWLIFWIYRLGYEAFWMLVPALLIFNLSTVENSLWAMASLQNHWVIFWSLSALFTLILASGEVNQRNKLLFVLSLVLSVTAHFTAGNGVMVLAVGILLLLFAGRGRYLGVWILFHALFYFFYFHDFERFGMSQRPHLERFLINLFDLSGSFVYPLLNKNISTKLPLLAGFLQLLYTSRVFFKVFFRKDNREEVLTYIALMSFLWGTLVLIAAGRSDYDPLVLLSSKYKIYSFLIFAVNVLYHMGHASDGFNVKKLLFPAGITLFLFFNAQVSYRDDAMTMKSDRLAELVNLKRSEKTSGKYRPPAVSFEKVLFVPDAAEHTAEPVILKNAQDQLLLEVLVPDVNAEYYVWFVNNDHQELVALHPVATIFGQSDFRQGSLILFNFPAGTYRLYLVESSSKGDRLLDPQQEEFIQGTAYSNPKKNW